MRLLRALARTLINQLKNIKNLLTGQSLVTPHLGSMTLESDDLSIAQTWLRDRRNWDDGGLVRDYEDRFARWNGSRYAFAFMGARVALSACVHALGLKPGDEVILPGYTCVAVPDAFQYEGVEPVFCDIELDTYGPDANQVEKKITPRTKAILVHHLYGLVCRDLEKLLALAKKHDLKVIEDCAQSTGALYQEKKVGNFGDLAIFSSEQSKVFNTIRGGMAVTNDPSLAQKVKEYYDQAPYPNERQVETQLYNVLLNHYQFKHPQRWWRSDWANLVYGGKRLETMTEKGEKGKKPADYGQRMPAPIAAIGLNQLRKIDRFNEIRRRTAKSWDDWCEKRGFPKACVIPGSTPVFLRYPILVSPEQKRDTRWAWKELRVEIGVWFLTNIHPVEWPVTDCPQADRAVAQCINLPCIPE